MFTMLGTNWSKFQDPQKPIWTRVGPFVVPEPALKMGPRNQARTTKKRNTKKCEQHKTKCFFLQNGAFSDKQKNQNCFVNGIGLLAFCGQRPVMATARKHYRTMGFCCFCCCIFCCSLLLPQQQQHNNKTTHNNNNNNNLNNQIKNKQQLNNNHGTPNSSKRKNKDTKNNNNKHQTQRTNTL